MNENLRQHQEPKLNQPGDGDPEAGGISNQANAVLHQQLAAVDAMIDNILSSETIGGYLESTRQRGGQ